MKFIEKIKLKAARNRQTIILPESDDKRILEAAEVVLSENIANIILIGDPNEINSQNYHLENAIIINPKTDLNKDKYIKMLTEMRRDKGMTEEQATKLLEEDYMYYACMLLHDRIADGVVSGACHSSANTLRPALQILKTKPGVRLVSGFFLMTVPDCQYGHNGTFIFADCGLEQNPDPEKLAAIAATSARSFQLLVEEEPLVAMLSHSSKGSANHPDVEKVIEATKIAKQLNPDLKIDGELQLDAAIVPEIALFKAPDSEVAGKANVLVFPDLDAGNIGYKLVQRLAKAEAYGPLTQGMNAPVNDLSRGCSVEDIVGVIAITCVQAQICDYK